MFITRLGIGGFLSFRLLKVTINVLDYVHSYKRLKLMQNKKQVSLTVNSELWKKLKMEVLNRDIASLSEIVNNLVEAYLVNCGAIRQKQFPVYTVIENPKPTKEEEYQALYKSLGIDELNSLYNTDDPF